MPAIKVYNKETQRWEYISVPDADNIEVTGQVFKEKGQSSVESVLESFNSDISTLKGNVAWLAKYGGGGSGGGGGTGTEAYILVNGLRDGLVTLDDEGLVITVRSSSAKLKWSITATAGGSTVIKSVSDATSMTISKAEWEAVVRGGASLNISIYNTATLTSAYWDGTVEVSSVKITPVDPTITEPWDNRDNILIKIAYVLGSTGVYRMEVNGSACDYGIVYTNLDSTYDITVGNLPDEVRAALIAGENNLNFKFVNVNNEDVFGTATVKLVLTQEVPIVVCDVLSTDPEEPTDITFYTQTFVVAMPFTVYSSAGITFKYRIDYVRDGVTVQGPTSGACLYNEFQANASVLLSNIENEGDCEITVNIIDGNTGTVYDNSKYYIHLVSPQTGGLLDNDHTEYIGQGGSLSTDTLFDFRCATSTVDAATATMNSSWGTVHSSSINIVNINNGSSQVNPNLGALRLQNSSYLEYPLAGGAESFTTGSSTAFTVEICYKCDYHPDDDRVVMQWGSSADINPNTHLPLKGIVIRDHDLWVGGKDGKVCVLEDEEIINIAITYLGTPDSGNYFVYVDGVIEAAGTAAITDIIPNNSSTLGIPFYIAAGMSDDGPGSFTDMYLYRFAFYNKCLSPWDIMVDSLNNEALSHPVEGSPDITRIQEGLRRNFISLDESGKITESILYNRPENGGGTNFNNNQISESSGETIITKHFNVGRFVLQQQGEWVFRPDLENYNVPIPVVFIEVPGWKWSQFIAPKTQTSQDLVETTATFRYYNQDQSHSMLSPDKRLTCTVKPQGTSTLANYIKNIDITFPDGTVFSPSDRWFPEQTYTLKADIVDSSHSMNASIGKFVNTELGLQSDGSSFYPYSEVVKNKFESKKNLPVRTQTFPNATLKHGVEGFPCFVIMRFGGENSGDPDVIKSLGIFQFILGRKSPRNLGYEIVTSFSYTDADGTSHLDPTFTSADYPLVLNNAEFGTDTTEGLWIEFKENSPFDDSTDIQETTDQTFGETVWGGPFWQQDPAYYNTVAEIKYSNVTGVPWEQPGDVTPFINNFIVPIQKFPVLFKRYGIYGAQDKQPSIVSVGSSEAAEFKKCVYNSGRWSPVPGEMVSTTAFRSDLVQGLVNSVRMDCITRYFATMMFFGSLDNFMKNMPIKFFSSVDNEGRTVWELPLLGIYDTDTGAGQDNQSAENVDEAVWLCGLTNQIPIEDSDVTIESGKYYYKGEQVYKNGDYYYETSEFKRKVTKAGYTFLERKSISGVDNATIVGTANKLWYIDHPVIRQAWGGSAEGSIWTNAWYAFVNHFKSKGINWSDLANYYYNNYFLPQTEGCGELLFNLTYIAKYIIKYKTDESGSEGNQLDSLHGRRRYQVKRWMNNRLIFLNSLFTALGSCDGSIIDSSATATVAINAALGPKLTTVVNAPVLLGYTNQGGGKTSYIFCNKNVESDIYFGSSVISTSGGSFSSYSHTLTNPNQIIKIGGGVNPLYNVGFGNVKTGALPYLYDYDVSAPSRSPSNWNGLLGMSNDYMKDRFRRRLSEDGSWRSELRNIDFRNTYPATGVNSYDLDLSEGFDKLQTLYINNSCITRLVFPTNTSLRDFDISGSSLSDLEINGQNFITVLNLRNCAVLGRLIILNCLNLANLSLDSTNQSLNTVLIQDCPNLKTFTCTGNKRVNNINLDCTGLEDVTITDCVGLESLAVNITSLKTLTLTGCTNLKRINFIYDSTDLTAGSALTKFQCDNTQLQHAAYNVATPDNNLVDLSMFPNLSNVNFRNNAKVEYIQFVNNYDNPIPLTNAFQGCSELRRVYGHVRISAVSAGSLAGMFRNCSHFSIHGTDIETWNGHPIKHDKGLRDGVEQYEYYTPLHLITGGDDPDAWQTEVTRQDLFVEGMQVTNFALASSSSLLSYLFYGTSCTTFDVYYFFNLIAKSNLSNNVSVSYTFYNLQNDVWDWKYGNNPDRYMFWGCSRVTSFGNAFTAAKIYLPSPSVSDSSATATVTADDGLLSPLTNLTSFAAFGGTIFCSKYLFRRKTGNYASLSSINTQSFTTVFSNDNMSFIKYYDSWGITELMTLATYKDYIGDYDGFFDNLTGLTSINNAFSALKIRYDTVHIPRTVTVVRTAFNGTYGSGDIIISSLFPANGTSTSLVREISNSFRVTTEASGFWTTPTLVIYENMFISTPKLAIVGYNDKENYGGSVSSMSFGGVVRKTAYTNVTKEHEASMFPYNIVGNLPDLEVFAGFFENLTNTSFSLEETVQLPGPMFQNNTKLKNVACLFRNVNFRFSLTGNGFANCTVNGLQNVYRLFYHDISSTNRSKLVGYIPYHMFYHGGVSTAGSTIEVTKWQEHSYSYHPMVTVNIANDVRLEEGHYYYHYNSEDPEERVEVFFNETDLHWYYDPDYELDTIATKLVSGREIPIGNDVEFREGEAYYGDIHVFPGEDLNYHYGSPTGEIATKVVESLDIEEAEATVPGEDPYFKNDPNYGHYREYPDARGVIAGFDSETGMGFHGESYSVSYSRPNQKLETLTQCFYGCLNLQHYTETIDPRTDPEPNPDYVPSDFNYKFLFGTWIALDHESPTYNKRYLGYWKYNGLPNSVKDLEGISDYLYLEDLGIVGVTDDVATGLGSTRTTKGETLNYMAAPDLLRYCVNSSTTSVVGLFENCGINYRSQESGWGDISYSGDDALYMYGITGRICPYLMKNLSNVTDYSRMFKFCRRLGSYRPAESSVEVYQISPDFFTYGSGATVLQQTFEGLSFQANTRLNVFGSLSQYAGLDIRAIFSACVYTGTSQNPTEISELFSTRTIIYASGAFSNYGISITSNLGEDGGVSRDSSNDNLQRVHSPYTHFSNNFVSSYMNNVTKVYYLYHKYGSEIGSELEESYLPAGFLDEHSNLN